MKIRTIIAAVVLGTATLVNAQVVMNIDATQRGPLISPYQYGLFFEEINHAGDGGLYAELVKNRSFEDGLNGWSKMYTAGATISLLKTGLLNSVQQQALDLNVTSATTERMRGVKNEGYWGMKFVKDSVYRLSLWAKADNDNFTGNIVAQLLKSDGKTVIGEARLEGTVYTDKWNKLTATIQATDTELSGQLLLLTSNNGHLYLDVVSLFPDTWKGRENGLRPDLAQLLYDAKPTFLRFPGGCYVEGETSFSNAFQWKKTIGPIEERPGHLNKNWGYYSSDGLGFDEYLQLCEDLGAAPMFVVNVGLGHGYYIPMKDLDTLVQNTLDAIEYANGDGSTVYGAMRIKNGHPAPYNLKFIEIGNENYNFNMAGNSDQSYEYPARYYKFYQAIKAKYPEIVTIGNVEAWGTDNPTWRNSYPVELVDEHYYRSHSWMRDNYTKYDNYDRSIGVYNGEYAANYGGTFGTYGNMNSALGEAVYMLGMEKNSDVCRMASFAPIFMHESDPTWNYDMIHFNSGSHFVTPSYYVQQLMASNLGHQNLRWTESGNKTTGYSTHRVGVATWDTQASYDDVRVTATGEDGTTAVVINDNFSKNEGWKNLRGSWNVSDGIRKQTGNGQPCWAVNNTLVDSDNYTLELKARKDGGAEGFLIIFDYQDEDNYSWWNIGGWGNTKHCVEVCRNGSKVQSPQVDGRVNNGQWYDIKIEVKGAQVSCYMDGKLIQEYTMEQSRAVYQSVQLNEDETELIVKVVNPNAAGQHVIINTQNMTLGKGTVLRLASENGTDENTMTQPDNVKPGEAEPYELVDETGATLEVPGYSLSIYRFPVTGVGKEAPQPTVADYEEYAKEDEGMSAYLYAHMHSSGEYTCFALSQDGRIWNDLFNSGEALDTKANTVTGGMRDSYVCRLQSGKGFMLVGTDMTSALGWESNHIMDLMLSPDLVHWTKNVKIDLERADNLKAISAALGKTITAETMTAAWAPQVVYDVQTKNYVLYYSVGVKGDKHYIFYQLIDEELNILTEPRVYFAPGYDIIDADIVWNAVDQQYVMLFKCESTNGFDRATAKTLVPEADAKGTTVWTVTEGFHVGESNQAIEGMSMWRPIGELKWRLAYMNYNSNVYQYRMRYMDEHCLNVDAAGFNISGSLRAQHGSFLKLKQQEFDYLLAWEQVVTLLPAVKAYNAVKATEQHQKAIAAAEAALNTCAATLDENAKAMNDALQLLQQCDTDLRAIALEEAVKNGYGDLTSLIVNADFAQGTTGWDANTDFTAANGYVAEFYNKNFNFWQTVTGLPEGNYEVGVQAFYRNGGTAAYSKHVNGTEKLNAIFYANDETVPVVSLFGEKGYTNNPYTFPNDVTQANNAFGAGKYENTLQVRVTGGELKLGIRKTTAVDQDWCCFDNFTLKYLGEGIGIQELTATSDHPAAVYNLKGQRVKNAARQGIYIIGGKKMIK